LHVNFLGELGWEFGSSQELHIHCGRHSNVGRRTGRNL
jgi:hypothetical protein